MSEIPYKTITVSGPAAFEFLQAQLAADLEGLPDAGLSAWCTPKGRVICLFRVTRSDADFLLTLPTELADEAVMRLTMFRFRAKVEFDLQDALAEHLDMASAYDDWRLANLQSARFPDAIDGRQANHDVLV